MAEEHLNLVREWVQLFSGLDLGQSFRKTSLRHE
jgi:hypothetical protein